MFERKYGGSFEVKALDDSWEVSGYASTFGGQPDSYGDIIAAGAFTDSIAARKTRLRLQHEIPIGVELDLKEDDHGLFGRWKISQTASGAEARQLALDGVLAALSIGYLTEDAEFREDGVRVIRKATVYEVSMVDIPANESAVITNVKGYGLTLDEHLTQLRDAAESIKSRLNAGMAKRVSEGQPVKAARLDLLLTSSGMLRELADQMEALATPPPPPEIVNVGLELRRRRSARAGVILEFPQ